MKVQTAKGPIETSELGITYMHEHLQTADWSMRINFGNEYFNPDEFVDLAVQILDKMKEKGLSTFVDGTPINLGRDIHLIKRIADRTDVNIVVSTGFYHPASVWLQERSEDDIYAFLMKECTDGIADTGIKPGILKAATGEDGLTAYSTMINRAIARVSKDTGLNTFIHHVTENGHEILDLYASLGVTANRIIMGHTGDMDNMDYIHSLLERGCYIGMDRFAWIDYFLPLDQRCDIIAQLCREGWANRMFLDTDAAIYLGYGGCWADTMKNGFYTYGRDFSIIPDEVIPALRARGVSQEEIDIMLKENPKRFFEEK